MEQEINRLSQMKINRMRGLLLVIVAGIGSICLCLTSMDLNDFLGKGCCLCILLYLVWKGTKEKYLINPLFLFCILPISLLVYYPGISPRYLSNLNAMSWLLIVWNIFALVLGFYLTKSCSGFNVKVGRMTYKIYDNIKAVNLLKIHFLIALFLGSLPTIYGLITGFGALISGDIYSLRNYFYAFPAASIIKFLQYFAIACAFKLKKKRYIALGILAQCATILMTFDKMGILLFAMTVGICWLKYYKISYVKICSFAIVFIVVMLWGFAFYDSIRSTISESMTDVLINRGDLFWHGPKALAMPYMYLVQGWNNVQYVLETQATHTWGLWFLNPILHYIPFKLDIEKELIATSFFNTFTYVGVQFKDFGILGSGLVSAFLGWWIKKIYTLFLQNDSPISACIYALNATAVFQMFFSNHFFTQLYPFTMCLILLIYEFVLLKINIERPWND